jgi:hypothetical protein
MSLHCHRIDISGEFEKMKFKKQKWHCRKAPEAVSKFEAIQHGPSKLCVSN